MGPTALSGRRRHATRPQAAKDTPERLWSTSSAGTGGPRPKSAGIWATKPAAAAEIHSASQNHGLCVGAVNRPSPWTRARAAGRARSSPVATAEGHQAQHPAKPTLTQGARAAHGTAGRPWRHQRAETRTQASRMGAPPRDRKSGHHVHQHSAPSRSCRHRSRGRPSRRPQGPWQGRRRRRRTRRRQRRAPARVVHRDHGPFGLRQEHVPQRRGRARPARPRAPSRSATSTWRGSASGG